MGKPIHTSGIIPYLARAKMWCARKGENLKASNSIKNLAKYLNNPAVRFGVWVEIKWFDMDDINSYRRKSLVGHFDLMSGEFMKSIRKDYTDTNKFIGDVHITADEQEVVKAVWERMKDRWQKKFQSEQKT
jgi:hypothetical protein